MTTPDAEDGLNDYNPDQPIAERRKIRENYRILGEEIGAAAETLVKGDKSADITGFVHQINDNMRGVKQTSDATVDARLFLKVAHLQQSRMQFLTAGNLGNGIDPDEFVSKAIMFMRRAAGAVQDDADDVAHTQRHRRRATMNSSAPSDDDDDEDSSGGDMMNWSHLGRYACLPAVRRPALPGFLLGPLSIEKKARKVVVRSAPLRIRDMEEVRPEVLDASNIAKDEDGDLTAICHKIYKQLKHVQASAHQKLRRIQDETDDEDHVYAAMERLGIAESGNVDLVRFCINPKSFGQTVENMFYVSFLIRDGHIAVRYEENGLPSLSAASDGAPTERMKSKAGNNKHQAVLSIDMPLWRELIQTFNITEPMIEHRSESQSQGPGAKGWYS